MVNSGPRFALAVTPAGTWDDAVVKYLFPCNKTAYAWLLLGKDLFVFCHWGPFWADSEPPLQKGLAGFDNWYLRSLLLPLTGKVSPD